MLKTRIIPTLLCRGRELVKGKCFDSTRRVGNTLQAAQVNNARRVDEMTILSAAGLLPKKTVEDLCENTFMPVTIGGGIRGPEDVEMLFQCGADKIAMNTWAVQCPDAITAIAAKYGAQSVVVSIDVFEDRVVIHNAKEDTGLDPVSWAHKVQCLGAGEVLINSVSRDGTLEGYDLDLIAKVANALRIPVVASGGCGTYQHMADCLAKTKAHAVAAGAMFIFTDQTPKGAAEFLARKGFQTRVDP